MKRIRPVPREDGQALPAITSRAICPFEASVESAAHVLDDVCPDIKKASLFVPDDRVTFLGFDSRKFGEPCGTVFEWNVKFMEAITSFQEPRKGLLILTTMSSQQVVANAVPIESHSSLVCDNAKVGTNLLALAHTLGYPCLDLLPGFVDREQAGFPSPLDQLVGFDHKRCTGKPGIFLFDFGETNSSVPLKHVRFDLLP